MNKLSKSQKLVYDMEKYAGGSIAVICGSMLIDGSRNQEELTAAVNELYRLNTALRTRIKETDGGAAQFAVDYAERDIDVLRFDSKDDLDRYAGKYAQQPFDLYGELCEISIVLIPGHYGLLVKFHHIIGDAWTIALIGTQFNTILNGEVPVAYPYAEYLESESEYLQSSRYAKSRTFFLEQFKKCDEVVYLSEKQTASFTSNRRTFVLKGEKAAQIYNYSKAKGVSPFVLFLSSAAIYINRTKQNADKFYIGTTVLNRASVREKNTMGMFVNTVPVLMELDNEKSVAENIAAVKKAAFSIFRHQKFNYGDVLAEIRKEFGFTDRLYDVMLSYQNAAIVGGKAESTWYHNGAQTEALQIHIDDRDNEGIFRIHFDYQTDKFTVHEIDRMYGHIINLLLDAINNDSKLLHELEILSADEKQKLLHDFNDTTVDYPRDKCVHQLFEEQAKRTPEETAVIACDRTFTYGELNEQANRIANSLIEQGVKPGDIVAFVLPRRSYLIAAMFGILKAGAAYLPIDPDHPQDRINYMVEDSGAAFFITEDNIIALLEHNNNCDPNVGISANAPCYCIYTSGSTGRPKGTVITHRNVVNYTHNNSDNVVHKIIKSNYRTIVSVTTVGFDIFVTESILPLLNGLEIILADERQATIQSELNSLLAREKTDVLQTTPTKMRSMIGDAAECAYLNSLKAIILGGEAVDGSLIYTLKQLTSAHIFNIYGPTETTVWSTNTEIFSDTDITIGKPIANTQIYIVDRYMQPVPIGVTGELCIAGDGVGAGYLNRPELTAEKFINNPFGNGKLYKTGDLAYWREDGNIVYVGRNDFQVKIRGLRIELGEIENALQGVQGILQAVVTVRKDEGGRQIVCAFYTGQETDGKILRAAIGQSLPKYMLPHSFTHLDKLPLTSSGKVNRKALPEVDLSNIANTVEYIAPKTEAETAVINAVQSVLHTIKVGTADNFFDLGGDSLKAIELISALEKAGYHTDVKTLFECGNIRNLAIRLTPAVEQQTVFTELPNEVPATPAQMRVYTAQAMQGGTAYNVPYAFRASAVEPERLQKAVQVLIDQHEALRTHFEDKNGRIVQVVEQEVSIQIERLDTDDISAFVRPFDLSKAPLLRVGYYGNMIMVDMHHIITDGTSMPIFLRELNELYMGRTLGPAPVPYRQFAMEQQDYGDSETYWLSVYSDELPVLELNTDFKREQQRDFRGSVLYESLDSALHQKIITTSRKLGITPYVFYIGGFYILLSKFSGNEDIVVGTPMSGRVGVYLDTIGMFVNTVAQRGKPVGTKTVSEFLAEVKGFSIDAVAHQDYPYGKLVKKLGANSTDRNPLFDAMFAFQSEKMTDVVFGDKKAELLPVPVTTSKYDFTFNLMPMDNGVTVMVEYCTSLYRETTMRRLVAGYELVLSQMLDERKQIKDISAVTERESSTLLHDFNDTTAEYPRDKCVHQLFEEQARKMPEKTALIACDRTLTYGELNEQANRIAYGLIGQGVKPGDIVAFVLPRRSYLIAAMFGILKAGAAYLPLDPDYPKNRIDYLIHESAAKFCISTENIEEFLTKPYSEIPYPKIGPDNAFCALHTSGSTGVPKLSLLKHGGLSNFIFANQRFWEDTDTVVSATIVTFDAFTMDSVLSIAQGCQLVLASEDDIYNQEKFEKLFDYSTHNMFFSTPTKIEHYIDNSQTGKFLSRIQNLVIGGEIFNNSLAEKIERYSNCHIFNIYGPTETTICITVDEVEKGRIITIGKPIANTQIYIVDRYMQPVPIGVTGELCIAGDGVGVGYLNRPELTAEKFIDNPFGNGKLYKTGDLACWREDGNIVYVGRNDFQVKIRGLRIELGEIENALQGVRGVLQAVVTVRKAEDGRQSICAFYTGQEMDGRTLRAAIGQSLPKYMLPHSFTHLDELPLTSSGKVNRKTLPEVDLSLIATAVEYVEPVGEVEKQLAALMEQVLGYSPIGRDDDFFDLGGDSLKAIELISALQKAGYHTDVKTLFECGNIRNLAVRLTPTVAQQRVFTDLPNEVPATPAQMRVYTAQAMQGGTVYNVPYAFRVTSVEPERLQKAVQVLVDRHEALRTHFEDKDGRIVQVVEQAVSIQVEQLDTDDISAFVRPFDLSKASLLRVGYCANTIMIDMHHIITDGASMPIFLRELNEAYMGRALGSAPVPYRQFAMEQKNYGDSEAYWLSVYSDELPVLELNTDFKREQKRDFSGGALYESLDSTLHQKILAASRKIGITPYVFYIGGFYILLSKFSGSEDIVVGTPMSGRAGAYLDTLGMFVNTVALRGKPAGAKTVSEFLAEVKNSSIEAVAHQDYPYGELVKKLGVNSTDRNSLFNVMFAFQSEKMTDVVFGDEKAELLPVPVTTSKYDFTFNLMPMDNGVTVMVEYCTGLYRETTMRRFAAGYEQILSQMLDERKQLKDISAVTELEISTLLHDFNDTAADYPRDKCVHQLFEEQVKKTPGKTALIACDRTLTYGELNEQANRIANGLIEQGVKPGDIVAFVLPRRSYLIAAMFGILKAGAAYLPIDPDYPQDRINYMVEDSGAAFFITENNITTLLAHNNVCEPNVAITLDYPCYCIYTSGSTGRPKGTVLKHRGMVNYTRNTRDNHVVHEIAKAGYQSVVSVTTVGFDIFATESVLPLVNGLTVILADEKQAMIQAELNSLLARKKADVLQTTPTKMRSLMGDTAECAYLNSLKAIILGGEAVDSSLIHAMKQLTSAHIFNIYGPTETTVWSTNTEIFSDTDITIGRPIANTQIYIVDRYMQLVPIGVTGELCIAGDGVGAGYLNRPELTAEKFIDNPFGNGKLYKTGDLAYWREDGNIVYVSRNDFQVKIRGLRIELGEIENALQGVQGILQAVVTVRKAEDGRQLICAFYTGQEADGKVLRAAIGQSLPKYMLPHSFTHLDELPLTSSGKVNRKALPEVDLSQIATASEYIEPVGEVEKQLAALMEQVLGYSPIGGEDDFFDLGGDSLKAIEFVSKAHSEGIYFALQSIFDHPTVRKLTEYIQAGDKQAVFYSDADFIEINRILEKNKLECISTPQKVEVGNILLAGATGYLGIHILADYIEHENGIAFCLVRRKNQADSEKRLTDLLNFYFGGRYSECDRIRVLCADLQKEHLGLTEQEYEAIIPKISTVINAAASVKHYGSYQYFYEANVETVKRLIEFCRAAEARLIHTSTLSVSGNSFAEEFSGYISETEKHFFESSLYIGQPLDNVYAHSKFEAEKVILEAMGKGLKANILRMGNLSNRLSDGVFQKNHETNAALKRVKAVLELGMIPDYLMDIYAEFTPIDEAARAVMLITQHFNTEQTVFHINSTKVVYLDKLLNYFSDLSYPIEIVDGTKFTAALRKTMEQNGMKHIFETFIGDLDVNDRLNYDSNIRIGNDFTSQYLRRLGFEWSGIGLEYFRKYVRYFKKIGYLGDTADK